MNKYGKTCRLLTLLALLTQLCACTEVDLCNEAEHPHRGDVTFAYQWDAADVRRPDSMLVAAVRVLNLWKCGIVIHRDATTDKTGGRDTLFKGRYIYNAPADVPVWCYVDYWYPPVPVPPPPKPEGHDRDTEVDDTEYPPTPAPPVTQFTHFALREGTYKFLTINMDTSEVNVGNMYDYMVLNQPDSIQMIDINMSYKTYNREDPALYENFDAATMELLNGWVDYNPTFSYIKTGATPFYFDTLEIRNVYKNLENSPVVFHPKRITQNIDIYIEIEKDNSDAPLVIDAVVGELSGIPVTMSSFMRGYVDLRKTAKVIFTTELVNSSHQTIAADTYGSTKAIVHANIDVTTVVKSESTADIMGPGIMQLVVKARAKDSNGVEHVIHIPGRINIYKSLEKANLIRLTDDGLHALRSTQHGTINVAGVKITGKEIIENADQTGGFKDWTDGGDANGPDIDPIEI